MIGHQTWTCPDCNNQLSQDIYPCPVCFNSSSIQHFPKKPSNKCGVCTFQNPENSQFCEMCGNILKQREEPILPQEPLIMKKSSINCPHCHQQNDLNNEICVFCEEELYEKKKKMCDICTNMIKETSFDEHYKNCLLTQSMLEEEEEAKRKEQEQLAEKMRIEEELKMKNNMEECIHCRQKYPPQIMAQHLPGCRQKSMKGMQFDPKTRMTKLQMQAMKHMTLKCEKQHNQARPELQKKIQRLGYTIQDLNNLQFYVQNYAPIIIHIHVSKHLQFFVKDTHYRSQFETNKSSGSLNRVSRTNWQNRMFDSKYANAKDFQRVKYGVINFTNDPKGVGVCSGYGPSYFLLKEHVRERCTFADMDSSAQNASLGTLRYCFKILNKLNDNELKAALDASKAIEISSKCTSTYKEMQIHGPVQFSKDIQCMYVNKNEIKGNNKLLDMVYQFCQKNGIAYDFI